MFDKVSRALSLARPCWRVLMLDKELLLFPLMSSLALIGILAGTIVPLQTSGVLPELLANLKAEQDPGVQLLYFGVLFAGFFICHFVVIFFNAGLVGCALIRFGGQNPTIADGMQLAIRHLPQIFAWALLTSTVGLLLHVAERSFKGIGSFFVGLLGVGWAVATYFAVPILVVDGVGPIDALKHSASAIRKTWGEALVGYIGFGALSMLATYCAIPLIVIGGYFAPSSPSIALGLTAVALVWIALSALVISTLSAIMRAALYIYAVEGAVPDEFDSQVMRNAFRG